MRIRIPLFKYIIFSLINFVFISSLFASSEPTSIDVGQLGNANNVSQTEELQTSKNNSSDNNGLSLLTQEDFYVNTESNGDSSEREPIMSGSEDRTDCDTGYIDDCAGDGDCCP